MQRRRRRGRLALPAVYLPADDDDMSETWSVTITFTPTGCFSLQADAELTAGLDHLSGRGDTRKPRAIHTFP